MGGPDADWKSIDATQVRAALLDAPVYRPRVSFHCRMPLTDFQRPGLAALVNLGGRLLGPVLGRFVDLKPDDLIATARKRTGLENFGEPDFQPAMRALLGACESEARLNLFGRLAVRSDVLRVLRNRLKLERDRQVHPGISTQEIRRPVFVVGLPRSGTTFLHRLLSQDPSNRVPLTWEGMLPSPPPEQATHDTDPRIEVSYQFDTMYRIPSYSAWMERLDFQDSYRVHRQLLQHLQWKCPGERWVLKAPNHLFQLPALLKTYPDACLVWTHRSPLETLGSLASLCTELRRVFSDSVVPTEVGPELAVTWAEGVRRAMATLDAGLIPPERILHVPYPELIRSPLGTVRKVYDQFEMKLSNQAERRLHEFPLSNPKGRFGKHAYSLEEFGLDRTTEQHRFAAYCERFLS